MSNSTATTAVLRQVFGDEWQGYSPAIARTLGSVAAAIFAQHIAFWQLKSEDGWAFRTQEEIEDRTALARRAQEGARKILTDRGILHEERRGVPARLHYRLDFDSFAGAIIGNPKPELQNEQTAQTRVRKPSKQERTNRTDYLVLEEVQEGSNPTGGASSDAQAKPVLLNQHLTKRLYDGLQEKYRLRMTREEFKTKLGQFEDVINKDQPTEEETERMLAWMLDTWKKKEKTPHDAIKAVRLGRDTGEAWADPPPWEDAQKKREGIHPQSAEAERMNIDKPRRAEWYKTNYPAASWDEIDGCIEGGMTHGEIVASLRGKVETA